jgi:thiol-disulfide isomerase/thioredoxin
MKRISLCFLLTFLLSACAERDARFSEQLDLAEYQGRWVVMNYWAEWCKPCLEEIPELNLLADHHADKLVVLGVNFDGLEGEALTVVSNKFGIRFPLLLKDPAQNLGFERPQVLPTTLIFDPAGKLQHTLIGPQTQKTLLDVIGAP